MAKATEREFAVLLLAAGVGKRLGQARPAPKVLLEFGGASLIERHLALLGAVGATEVTIVTGFMADELEAAIAAARADVAVSFVRNPRYREGSVVSLACGTGVLRAGRAVLLMDGDVLYDHRMLRRLLGAAGDNVVLVDRNIEPGDEPVKVCFDGEGTIVDFRKRPEFAHAWHGESVGFFRFSPTMAGALADCAQAYVEGGCAGAEYEEAIRDLMLARPECFTAADVTDLPWTEIDFPEDAARARAEILPRLEEPA